MKESGDTIYNPSCFHETDAGGFRIFIWPFKTDVLTDYELYRDLNLGGVQIDRGKGQHERIRFSRENDLPFYGGHVADKGYLYLKGDDKDTVMQKPGFLTRPAGFVGSQAPSLFQPQCKGRVGHGGRGAWQDLARRMSSIENENQ